MPKQPSLNPEMRAILIDWLVEVQVSCAGSLCGLVIVTKDFKGAEKFNTAALCLCVCLGEL